jgi:aubergine
LAICLGAPRDVQNNFNFKKDYKNATLLTPHQRASSIQDMLNKNALNEGFNKHLGNWNMQIDPRLVQLDARVLDPNTVTFGEGKKTEGIAWNFDGKICNEVPEKIEKWFVVCPKGAKPKVTDFIPLFLKESAKVGLILSEKVSIYEAINGYSNCLEDLIRDKDQFVLIILDRANQYKEVQKVVKEKRLLISQCCLLKTLDRRSAHTNLAVQIVTKLGGKPWVIENIFQIPTMICGISTIVKDSLSISASYDKMGASLYTRVGKISQLEDFLKSCVEHFFKLWEILPFNIIIYREGLTEGQENSVSFDEQQTIAKLLNEISLNKKSLGFDLINPEFQYITVSRHSLTRLFSQKSSTLVNPPSGTCVNHTIIDDGFYLFATDVRQGSGSPTRYSVKRKGFSLEDSIKDFEDFTYKLCYLYYNWNGTVAVPHVLKYCEKISRLYSNNDLKETKNFEILNDKIYYI